MARCPLVQYGLFRAIPCLSGRLHLGRSPHDRLDADTLYTDCMYLKRTSQVLVAGALVVSSAACVDDSKRPDAGPQVTSLSGTVFLSGVTSASPEELGSQCDGTGAGIGVATGAPVAVTDGAGNAIGTGAFGPGKYTQPDPQSEVLQCTFRFEVEVPADEPIYILGFGNGHGVAFQAQDLQALDWHVVFNL